MTSTLEIFRVLTAGKIITLNTGHLVKLNEKGIWTKKPSDTKFKLGESWSFYNPMMWEIYETPIHYYTWKRHKKGKIKISGFMTELYAKKHGFTESKHWYKMGFSRSTFNEIQ